MQWVFLSEETKSLLLSNFGSELSEKREKSSETVWFSSETRKSRFMQFFTRFSRNSDPKYGQQSDFSTPTYKPSKFYN